MRASEINKGLIGKKVSCVNLGEKVNGIIIDIFEDVEHIGVRIKHNPIQWGADTFTTLLSCACKGTELMEATEGNLKNTKLI